MPPACATASWSASLPASFKRAACVLHTSCGVVSGCWCQGRQVAAGMHFILEFEMVLLEIAGKRRHGVWSWRSSSMPHCVLVSAHTGLSAVAET